MGAILSFPQTIEAAWDAYSKLMRERAQSPELAINIDHCRATARAWDRWQRLFLAEDRGQ